MHLGLTLPPPCRSTHVDEMLHLHVSRIKALTLNEIPLAKFAYKEQLHVYSLTV
jgi:hypothetical protein